ncbi:MAG TPA: peptidoglycan DD-metalloendopeptidase family protein [Bacteroidales bacterium]|nr:peptidoglycan DD-metalloendopeptidase family protein [Bacteroidales bacterium]HPR11491.1 peptidoglycan DD-metalloendopeptidase family protein [Bacteroidales bacterium]
MMMSIRKRTLLLIILIFTILTSCRYFDKPEYITEKTDADTLVNSYHEPLILFGIPADSFNIDSGKIRRNGFLSEILLRNGVPVQEINKVITGSDSVFDVRKIRSGNNYLLFLEKDSGARARYLVYEHDPVLYYIFSFNDSLKITAYRKEIRKLIRYSSGTIENSLWESMVGTGLHPSLPFELSEIFAWTVDFFGIQKGDSYKVIYEELFIDDKSLGAGRIFGAQFIWGGKTITAIPFIQDGKESYYDEEGNSLRKAFLKAPLRYSRISSRYSSGRLHPILRIRRPHFGVDYAAAVGTPVQSVGDGRITFAGIEGASGRIVRITHNSVYSTAYLHLSRFGEGVRAGATVRQGDIIGYVGSSGLSTGPHLDFRFYRNGSPVDPLTVEAPPVEPVKEENLERFEKNKILVLSLLSTFRF